MIEYLYFVKWLDDNGIAEEVFEFFDEAKSFALGLLSQQPEIHQTEVIRNDFGECVDSNELGKVWSWEELMDDIPENAETDDDFHIFTRGDFDKYADGYDPDNDPEFDDRDITFETDCVACEHPLDEDYDKPVQIRTVKLPSFKGTIELNICMCKDEREYDYDDGEENYEIAVNGFINDEEFMLDNEKLSSLVRSGYTYLTHMLEEDAKETLEKLYKYFSEIEQDDIIDNLLNLSDEYSYNFLKSLNESCRKPIPEGKSIKDLVEEMEENEDMVECKWCDELFDKSECRYEVNMGWLCPYCIAALKSRGEELTFREGSLDEDYSLHEAYPHLATLDNAKEQLLDELKNNRPASIFFSTDGRLRAKANYIWGIWSPTVTDFILNDEAELEVVFIDPDNGIAQFEEIDYFMDGLRKGCAAYDVLKQLKVAAAKLNSENNPRNPRAAAARDRNIDTYLANNPDIANELKKHITNIQYEIPKFEDERELESLVDKDGIPIRDNKKALQNLKNIYNNFFNSNYFGDYGTAADEAGMVTDRLPSVVADTHYGVSEWGARGKISFDTNLKNLTELHAAIHISRGEPADAPSNFEGRTIDCVRLAKALTKYFDNIKFYEEAAIETPKSDTEATPLIASLSKTNNGPGLKEHFKHKRSKRI